MAGETSPTAASVPDAVRQSDEPIAIGKVDTMAADEVEKWELSAETYAAIMAKHKPNVLGSGYIRLYLLCAAVFFCSTMNGKATAHLIDMTRRSSIEADAAVIT